MERIADIIIPTHNHPLLLPYSIRSALSQTISDVRVVVIGDGVGDDTRDVMLDLLREDSRLEFHDLPKSGRTGELHRHPIVSSSDAKILVYNGDDDLMAPDHVEKAFDLLKGVDVVVPIGTHLLPDGEIECNPWSPGEEPGISMMRSGISLFSLSGLSHTTAAYRRLPFGWRSTPPGFHTDHYMILQFMSEPWCAFGLIDTPTVIHLADDLRRGMSAEDRLTELQEIDHRLALPAGWEELRSQARNALRRRAALHHRYLKLATDQIEQLKKEIDRTHLTTEHLRSRAEWAELQVQQLNATRAIRIRDALVRYRLVRFLASRRR